MGVFYQTIPKSLVNWVLEQKVFWVATAPLSANGHVNVSPKGGPCFGLVDERTFWYMDMTGSGNETISHIHEPGNGRITVMFNAFDGPPKIVRFWGKGRVLENGTTEFEEFVKANNVKTVPGTRSVIVVDIHQVGSSCGFSVPFFDFKSFRNVLNEHFAKKEERFKSGKTDESMDRYWAYKNAWSVDGLPGMKRGLEVGKREKVAPIKKMVGFPGPVRYSHSRIYSHGQLLAVALLCFVLGILSTLYWPMLAQRLDGHAPLKLRTPLWRHESIV